MNFLPLPGGTFFMGESDADKFANDTERPRREVTIPPGVEIAIDPVTVGEFRAFAPAHSPAEADDLPVTDVSWQDASDFAAWFSNELGAPCRLPTEAEWEYACRAGTTTAFACGNELPLSAANYLYSEHGERIGVGAKTPVGTYPANAFGLRDMHGNVCEWVADRWRPAYDKDAVGSLRVIRGGAWDYLPRLLRSSWRDALPETTRRDNLGFRLARED
ncbi:MAG: formylglycine-generating enzyme family protein [Chthoniobacterales bacterium]